MYKSGVEFDIKAPIESKFLYNLSIHSKSPALADLHKSWQDMAIHAMINMIQYEQEKGYFRKDLPIKTLAFMLMKISQSIGEYIEFKYHVDFRQNVKEGKPVFAEQKELLYESIDEYILLMKSTFAPNEKHNKINKNDKS